MTLIDLAHTSLALSLSLSLSLSLLLSVTGSTSPLANLSRLSLVGRVDSAIWLFINPRCDNERQALPLSLCLSLSLSLSLSRNFSFERDRNRAVAREST